MILFERITIMEEEFIIGVSHNNKKKSWWWWLLKVSFLFHWKSSCRLWNTDVGGGILFLDKQLALWYWEKLVVECILSKSTDWWRPAKTASYKRQKR